MSTADRLWPPVILVSDRRLAPVERLVDVARVAAREGLALAVQLREKDLTAADLLETALRFRQALGADDGAARVAWAINGRFDLALAAGADGVHLPAGGPPVERVRAEVGSRLVLGVSTHSVDEIAVAARAGADYVMFGPIYETPSKAGMGRPQGLAELRRAVAAADPVPVVAVGGITTERAAECRDAGARGAALIRGLLAAEDPAAVARRLQTTFPERLLLG
jgi:thiamine-phosphate pyrophosphorylase